MKKLLLTILLAGTASFSSNTIADEEPGVFNAYYCVYYHSSSPNATENEFYREITTKNRDCPARNFKDPDGNTHVVGDIVRRTANGIVREDDHLCYVTTNKEQAPLY